MAKLNSFTFLFLILAAFQFTIAAETVEAPATPATTTSSQQNPQPLPAAQNPKPASQMIEGTCVGKEFCLTVFVAPWNPACNNSISTFKALHQNLLKIKPDMGFVVVVGEDNMENLLRKKSELQPIETYTDSDGSFFRNRKIQGFPTWIVYNKDGQEIKRQNGEQRRTSLPELEDLVKKYLGFEK